MRRRRRWGPEQLQCSTDDSPLTPRLPVRASFSGDNQPGGSGALLMSEELLWLGDARREDERCRPPVWAGQRQRRTATPLVQRSQLDNVSWRATSLPRQHQRRCSKCSKQAGGGPSLSCRDSQLCESKVNHTETKWGLGWKVEGGLGGLQLGLTLTMDGGAKTALCSHWVAVAQWLSVGTTFFHSNFS